MRSGTKWSRFLKRFPTYLSSKGHCSCAQSRDGWQTFNCESDSQYCWHLPRASKEHSAQRVRNVEGFLKMEAKAFDAWPKADQADPVTS